jgi:hypothetical protein
MTLRTLISFDGLQLIGNFNLSQSVAYGGNNALQQYYGQPGTIMSTASPNPASIAASSGWLSLGASGTNVLSGYAISFADLNLFQNGATQAWIGCRTYANNVATPACNVVGLCATPVLPGAITPLLTEAQLNRTVGIANAQYVETFFDMTALTYTSYVNGIQVATGTFPAGMQYVMFGGQIYNSIGGQFFRDFYFLDVDSTKPNARLGPITSTPLLPAAGSTVPNYIDYVGSLTGNASISTAQAKFGAASLLPSNATASAVSFPDSPQLRATGTTDWTIEAWVYNTSAGQTGVVFAKDINTIVSAHLTYASGNWQLLTDGSGLAMNVASGMALNTWVHVALVRSGNVWTLYQNGVALATAPGATFGNNTNPFLIGNWGGNNAPWLGYIDEVRVSNVARYTAAFTPPVAAFQADANTMLLAHLDSALGVSIPDYGGNVPSVFNVAYGASPAMTPYMQNAPTNDTITLNFAPVVATNQKVVAMQYKLAAQVPFAINLQAKLVQGGSQKGLPTYQFPDTLPAYGRDLAGIQALAPDGTAWTAASIAATNLALTPQSQTVGS